MLAGRVPELYVSVLGALKHGAVACPLFSAFGPGPIRQRLDIGGGRVLVTTDALYRRKVAGLRDRLPELEHVLVIGPKKQDEMSVHQTQDFHALMDAASELYEIGSTDPEEMALLHFTSGTTGTPKGAVHVHEAVVAHHATGRLALDLHPDDVFWCTADPGWVTDTSYGIVAPLTHGVTSVVDEGEFDAERWYRILGEQQVSVWYTAPTAVRMMMKVGADVAREYDLPQVRFIASVGEPLNPEAVQWGVDAFGLPIHDNWWQTETGGIMIAQRVTACFFGEGAVAEGEFHECLNRAALWDLPVFFCCENDLYAMGTDLERSESEIDLVLKAASYEMPAWSVDGMDVVAVEDAARRVVEGVRGGGGPHFLECRTYRFRAHSMYDPELYRDKAEVEAWKVRDPLVTFAARLAEAGILDDDGIAALEAEVAAEIEAAVEFAEAGTLEPVEDVTKFVYHEAQA